MEKKQKYAGLIVAAGMSTRMKECKQLMKWGDYTFIEHIVRRFLLAGVDKIVVVTGYRFREVEDVLKEYPVTFVRNMQYEHTQMFDSVKMGLKEFVGHSYRIFFCPVDVPLFSLDTLREEMKQKEDVVFPISGHKIGHPVLISSDRIEEILKDPGTRGLKGALDSLGKEKICYLPVSDKLAAVDADTMEDIQRMKQIASSQTAIFGAGQVGKALFHRIEDSDHVCAFIDNNTKKQGTMSQGVPVLSLAQAMKQPISTIIVAMKDPQRIQSVVSQLHQAGYQGTIETYDSYFSVLDERILFVRQAAKQIENEKIAGAVAELGVFTGEFAAELNRCFPTRTLYLLDTFEGFDPRELKGESVGIHPDFTQTDPDTVLKKMKYKDRVEIIAGRFPDTAEQLPEISYALVSLDADLYAPTKAGLEYFYPRLSEGGMIVIHDVDSEQFPGVKKAVDEYCRSHHLHVLPLCDLHGSVVLIKQGEGA
ncbi:MAG: NTP transferase domain-containing protein [Erysipelotrichaceae bacterium]|nr:NTP transferase domain-containing protein [Erysipelotrichaceae bacterium]